MTKISSWMRSISRYPLLARYGLRHARLRLRIEAKATQERLVSAYLQLRRAAYKTIGKAEPMPLAQQRDQLVEFYERYEDLVDLLCNAARFEDPEAFESSYSRLRDWMRRHYPPIRPYLLAFLKLDSIDDSFGLRCKGRATDGFEALFIAETIREAIDLDQGFLIERMQRTRSALNRYGDHLRRQSALKK